MGKYGKILYMILFKGLEVMALLFFPDFRASAQSQNMSYIKLIISLNSKNN